MIMPQRVILVGAGGGASAGGAGDCLGAALHPVEVAQRGIAIRRYRHHHRAVGFGLAALQRQQHLLAGLLAQRAGHIARIAHGAAVDREQAVAGPCVHAGLLQGGALGGQLGVAAVDVGDADAVRVHRQPRAEEGGHRRLGILAQVGAAHLRVQDAVLGRKLRQQVVQVRAVGQARQQRRVALAQRIPVGAAHGRVEGEL
ncbi:MAG TPA: hypothetical protein P5204_09615, partial [Kiritimatiellia bacterium]|nr:hypothetical protein [Kiritimatiellia bacterium]